MSAKVIHLAGVRASREQHELLKSIARGLLHVPVEAPPARVLTMPPDQIDKWLREERLSPADFWRGLVRQPLPLGDVADAINALLRGRDAYVPPGIPPEEKDGQKNNGT